MSLDWDVGKVKDWKEVCFTKYTEEGGREMRPLTKILLFGMMAIDISSITEENKEEVYKRFCFVEMLNGPFRTNRYITPEEIESHIGFTTNVHTKTTRRWLWGMWESWEPSKPKEA